MDYNSEKNQLIVKAFCEKECFADMTEMVQFILDESEINPMAPFCQEFIENEGSSNKAYFEISKELEELELEEPDSVISEEYIQWYEKYSNLEMELNGLELSVKWIAVSKWLGERLMDEGEEIIDCITYYFWGIKTSENPCDREVLFKIAEDVEILEGQKNDWSKYLGGS